MLYENYIIQGHCWTMTICRMSATIKGSPTLAGLFLILSDSSQPSLKPHQSERSNTFVCLIISRVTDNLVNILFLAFTIFGGNWRVFYWLSVNLI